MLFWQMYIGLTSKRKKQAHGCFPKLFNGKHPAASQTHTDVDTIFIKPYKVVGFILINLNDNCVFFTEEANSIKKLSIDLPSKIPLLNPTIILAPLTKPVVDSKSEVPSV